jgi:galactonate dehydratase
MTKIARIEPLILNVSEKTNWFFLRVTLDDGTTGLGEASLNGWETAQLAYAETLSGRIIGKPVRDIDALLSVYPHSPGGLIASSVASGIEQAITDAQAKRAGVPLHEMLGKARRKRIPVYANINRGARDRTPAGIARAAASAVAEGYSAIKIAPFDGVLPGQSATTEGRERIQAGIERVFAIREAVGLDIRIMADCHWRFDEAAALDVARRLAPAKLSWLECPISENADGYESLARVRDCAHGLGMKLAGAERQIASAGFRPYTAAKLLDVIMPDVKYAGGYREMLSIAAMCERTGTSFSPHNPTGPVCNLASMHLCAVAPAFLILEHQLAESPLCYDLVHGYRPRLVDGCFELPEAPGLGIELDDRVLKAHPYRPLAANANLDPRLG